MARTSDRPRAGRLRPLPSLLVALLLGCASTGEDVAPVEFVEPLPAVEGLAEADPTDPTRADRPDPVDVWVAPVTDATTDRGAPAETLREELYRGLVGRLYSPLALAFGDAGLAEAREARGDEGAVLGPEAADAVLSVVVRGWDASRLEARGTIDASLELRFIDLRTDPPEQLWGRRFGRRLRLEPGLLKQATPGELQERAARVLAAEVLELVPARDPLRVDGPPGR